MSEYKNPRYPTEEDRAVWQNRARAKQLIAFRNMKRDRHITPTDIDGLIEARQENAVVFYEFKYRDTEMPAGQRMALEELVDSLEKSGKSAVAFLCSHDVTDPNEDVDAAEAEVTKIYMHRKWFQGRGRTCREETDRFLAWAGGQR